MRMAKKYYWLKLKNDFFTDKRIKKLRRIAGGDTYTIIYLKMMLASITNDGLIEYEGIEDDFADELALDLDEEVENVRVTISFLMRVGLLVEVSDNKYLLSEVPEITGSETASAQRVREHRKRQEALQCNTKALQCNADVTEVKRLCNVEKEKEKEKELELELETDIYTDAQKEKPEKKQKRKKEPTKPYGEYGWVKLTDKQYEKLVADYDEKLLLEAIKCVDEYYEEHQKKAKDITNFNLVLRRWGFDAALREREKKGRNGYNNFNRYEKPKNDEQGAGATVSADPSEQYTKEQWADIERYYEENREDLPWL